MIFLIPLLYNIVTVRVLLLHVYPLLLSDSRRPLKSSVLFTMAVFCLVYFVHAISSPGRMRHRWFKPRVYPILLSDSRKLLKSECCSQWLSWSMIFVMTNRFLTFLTHLYELRVLYYHD